MEPCISARQGFIDKFIGDAIMALFHTGGEDAIEAALAMLAQLDVWNAQRAAAGDAAPVRIGIGGHTGSLLLGTVGGENRMEGTVISEAVSLASRVEGLTKAYGVPLLLTEETFAQLRDPERFAVRMVDRLRFLGSTHLTGLYEVFEADPPFDRAAKLRSLPAFERAQALYRTREFARAAQVFEAILTEHPADRPALMLGQRCRRLAESGVADDWTAAVTIEKSGVKV